MSALLLVRSGTLTLNQNVDGFDKMTWFVVASYKTVRSIQALVECTNAYCSVLCFYSSHNFAGQFGVRTMLMPCSCSIRTLHHWQIYRHSIVLCSTILHCTAFWTSLWNLHCWSHKQTPLHEGCSVFAQSRIREMLQQIYPCAVHFMSEIASRPRQKYGKVKILARSPGACWVTRRQRSCDDEPEQAGPLHC